MSVSLSNLSVHNVKFPFRSFNIKLPYRNIFIYFTTIGVDIIQRLLSQWVSLLKIHLPFEEYTVSGLMIAFADDRDSHLSRLPTQILGCMAFIMKHDKTPFQKACFELIYDIVFGTSSHSC